MVRVALLLAAALGAARALRAPRVSMSTAAPPKRLLVLGGTGFVGRRVCRLATQKGYDVTSLTRRGENPLPDDADLQRVTWLAGDATDAPTVAAAAEGMDAFVHCVGLLFDASTPGGGALNLVVSGSKSKPGAESTYDNITRKTALNLLAAAEALAAADAPARAAAPPRALCFVSAAEAGWPEVRFGDFVDRNLAPGWLKRYLAAKRTVEAALSASDAAGAIRAAVFRPSLIWDW